jgi:putative hydrolase of the HAD superfamily
MIRAVLFDLDDTLSDYSKSAKWSLSQVADYAVDHNGNLTGLGLQEAYYHARDDLEQEAAQVGEALYAKRSGLEVRYLIWERALQRCGVSSPLLARAVAARYGLERAQTISLFPDALPVLTRLKQGYALGLVVNGPADIQREQIERLRLEPFFSTILIEGEVGYGKPTPAVFGLAAEKVGCDPSEAVFVGDSLTEDIAGAKAAGLRAVWVNRAGQPLSSEDPAPNAEIVRLSDLPQVIADLSGAEGADTGSTP